MPDPRTAAQTRLADTGEAVTIPTPERRPLGLSLTQILGGALAAVTAAVAASFLGVAGTLTGAALGSIVSSIGAAFYSTSLNRAARASRVLVVRPGGLAAGDPAAVPPPVAHDPQVLAAAPADAVTAGPDDDAPVDDAAADAVAPDAAAPGSIWSRVRWRPVLLVAGVFFVAAMAVISVTEVAIGHPLSKSSGSGTTITDIGGSGGAATPVTSPGPASSVAPSVTSSPTSSAEPSAGVSPTASPTASVGAGPSASATPPGASPSVATSAGGGTTTPPGGGTTTAPAPSGAGPSAGG